MTGSALRKRDSSSIVLMSTGYTAQWETEKCTVSAAIIVGSLFLLDGAVVIDKHESAVVFWVDVTLGTLISGA